MIRDFNEEVLNSEVIDESSVVTSILKQDIDSTIIYDLCRETYLLLYNGEIFRDTEGNIGIYIDDLEIQRFGSYIESIINKISSDYDLLKGKVTDDLIDVAKRFYKNTATKQELESRFGVFNKPEQQGTFGYAGTLYDFNDFPNWDEFELKLRKSIN